MDAHKVTVIVLAAAMVVFSITSPAMAVVEFNDGGIHDIDYEINDDVRVDYEAPGMQTTLNLLVGGAMPYPSSLYGYNDSHINLSGGSIEGHFRVYHSSRVTVSGGSIGIDLGARHRSIVTISGGLIVDDLYADDSSHVTVSGGSIGDTIYVGYWPSSESVITFLGTDFAIDGGAVGYGELTSIHGGFFNDEPPRRLTGVLASGDLLDNDFFIPGNSRIVLAPEPATVAFVALGLAGVVAARKRKQH
jgi:hypothetical protein